ncbi:MAG TPA: hypothetical protein VE993_22065 [Stellaceae bacterium]|nr:hypothetical protein [Stellaceae bacterium]
MTNRTSAAAVLARLAPAPDEIFAKAKLIENWLLSRTIQIASGPCAGGIAGWIEADGSPSFAYGEITGYWLTWIAGIEGERAAIAARAKAAVDFLAAIWAHRRPPQTRFYLAAAAPDWRNRAVFSFDMAMMLRGLAHAAELIGNAPCAAVAERIVPWLSRCIAADGTVSTHLIVDGGGPLLRRWSTESGPFQAKTAAAILQAPAAWLPAELASAARQTLAKWRGRAGEHGDMHPRLYALEGEILAGGAADARLAGTAVPPDGWLPEHAAPLAAARSIEVRADVLAQAIRILALAEGEAALGPWSPATALLGALFDHVTEEGAVLFRATTGPRNVWCALFAAQALAWLAACAAGRTIEPRRLV